jgi:hypothetical protein
MVGAEEATPSVELLMLELAAVTFGELIVNVAIAVPLMLVAVAD